MRYIITDIEKHNIETTLINSEIQIQFLKSCLLSLKPDAFKDHPQNESNVIEVQLMIDRSKRTMDNLMPVHEVWQDQEADVQKVG